SLKNRSSIPVRDKSGTSQKTSVRGKSSSSNPGLSGSSTAGVSHLMQDYLSRVPTAAGFTQPSIKKTVNSESFTPNLSLTLPGRDTYVHLLEEFDAFLIRRQLETKSLHFLVKVFQSMSLYKPHYSRSMRDSELLVVEFCSPSTTPSSRQSGGKR